MTRDTPSIRRLTGVATILFIAFIAVTAQPASASTHLATASSHTTDSDFNSATLLDNVTVQGSGKTADVVLQGQTSVDDYEDGDITEYGGDTANFNTTNNFAHDGTNSLQSVAGGGSLVGISSTSGLGTYPTPGANFTVWNQVNSSVAFTRWATQSETTRPDGYIVTLDSDNNEITLRVRDAGSTTTLDTTPVDVVTNTWYQFDVSWGTNGDINVTLRNDTVSNIGTLNGNDATFTSGGIGATLNSRGGDVRGNWDTWIAGGAQADIGTYISQTHAANNTTTGWTNLTLTNASATVTWLPDVDGDGTFGDGQAITNTFTTTANHTVDVSAVDAEQWRVNVTFQNQTTNGAPTARLHDEGLLFDPVKPSVTPTAPADGKNLSNRSVTLKVNTADIDFGLTQGDSVDLQFQTRKPGSANFGTNDTITITSNGTQSTTITAGVGGEWEWRVVANDSYADGPDTVTPIRTFNVPSTVEFRNVTNTSELITTPIEIEVKIFADKEIFNRTTTTGTLNLTGLPVDQPLIVDVTASQHYHERTVYLESIFEQDTVYLLNKSFASVNVTFTLSDNTGGTFSNNDGRLRIEKPVNTTDSDTPVWTIIHADEFGVGGVTAILQQNERYRLTLLNNQGDKRVLGTYNADTSELRELTASSVNARPTDPSVGYAYNATYLNTTSGEFVRFEYNDTFDDTDEVIVQIHERGNDSNVLLANQTFTGPLGSLRVTEPVTGADQDTEWLIEAWITRGSTKIHLSVPVSGQRPVLNDMADWLKVLISLGAIIVVAGLFSQLNGHVGGIAVAGLAGMFWYVDFVPTELGFGVLMLAMLAAGILFVHGQRSRGGL